MNTDKSSYRHIIRVTSIFGGVQVFNILIGLIRSKIVAIFLGPSGMGIASLYTSTINMVGTVTGLGIGFSAVRDISFAHKTNDITKISRVIKTLRRWVLFSGILGVVIVVLFSKQLSIWTFTDSNHTILFCIVSFVLLFNALNSGQTALLQGRACYKDLAKASLIGAIIGLIITTPLYFLWGIRGIVPALVLSSACSFLVSSYFVNKQPLENIKLTVKESFHEGLDMVKLGSIMMISSCIGMVATYLISIFVIRHGGSEDVGLYQAGIGITTQYIGLIFAAMSTEYFPRLITFQHDNSKLRDMVNQQSIITMLIVTPLLSLFIVFTPVLIRLIYSNQFVGIIDLVRWAALGMFFKATSYALGYLSFAKGDKRFFFYFEACWGSFFGVLLNIGGYILWGVTGIGVSFFIHYVAYLILLYILTQKRYSFGYYKEFAAIFFVQLCLLSIVFFIFMFVKKDGMAYLLSIPVCACICYYSIKELHKRIDIKEIILKYRK